jgi:cytochrome c oxidase assembly protein subunit 15
MFGLVGLHMSHRYGAYLLVVLLGALALRSRGANDVLVQRTGTLLFVLVLLQAGIGIMNIYLGIPVWVSALHLANAAFMLALSLIATFRLSSQPAHVSLASPRAVAR